jgi:hypothetical protein
VYFRRERKGKTFKEIIAEHFPNYGKEIDIKVQKPQRIPKDFNKKCVLPGIL